MKRLSIKLFFLAIVIIIILFQILIFTSFYQKSVYTTSTLLFENTKSNIITLKDAIEKNIKFNDAANVVAYLDNFTASHYALHDIHILNENKELIYSTDKHYSPLHPYIKCMDISELSPNNVLNADCYLFKVKVYKELTPHIHYAYAYIDKNFIDSLRRQQLQNYALPTLLFVIVLLLFLWFLIQKIMISPLEKLRKYAYYSEKPPSQFYIQELESIRYSLQMTFHRLKEEQKKFYTLSTRDPLTALLNRTHLMQEVEWLISQSKRSEQNFSLLFMDIDNFKTINDTYGHDFGDKVLKSISKRLKGSLRENDIIARFGGDEFVIVLPGITKSLQIKEVITKIQKQLQTPIKYKNFSFSPTISIGAVLYPQDGKDFTELFKNADIAMYKAKELGKNNFHFFTSILGKELNEKVKMQQLIKKALKDGNFQLYYQPQVDINSEKIIGCEALIRLIDPIEGFIAPDRFIPIAEETNLIIPIGRWVITKVAQQLKEWENTRLKDIKISMNMSALELNDQELLDYIKTNTKDINAQNLGIELTESVLIDNVEEKIAKIQQLKELGLTLTLDDFGTGYSSISYVKRLPFDYLKIDKSFIDDILHDPQDKLFVKIIIDMAKTLRLQVIAEGVENQEQLTMLKDLDCDIFQGYLASTPLPTKDFEKFFLQHKP